MFSLLYISDNCLRYRERRVGFKVPHRAISWSTSKVDLVYDSERLIRYAPMQDLGELGSPDDRPQKNTSRGRILAQCLCTMQRAH